MTTLTATEARRELFDLVKDANQKHKVFRIHHRTGDAILISGEDYEGLLETLELLSIPGFRESIKRSARQAKKGEVFSLEEVFGDKE
jgi:antitoxin YefM